MAPVDRRLRGRCQQKAEAWRSFWPGRWYPPLLLRSDLCCVRQPLRVLPGAGPALASALPLCQPLSGPVWGQMAMWASCQRDDCGCCTWGWAHFPGTCGRERSPWEEEQEPDEQEWDEAPDGQESRSFKLPRGSPPPHSSPPVGAGTVRQVVLLQGPVDLSARVC